MSMRLLHKQRKREREQEVERERGSRLVWGMGGGVWRLGGDNVATNERWQTGKRKSFARGKESCECVVCEHVASM